MTGEMHIEVDFLCFLIDNNVCLYGSSVLCLYKSKEGINFLILLVYFYVTPRNLYHVNPSHRDYF